MFGKVLLMLAVVSVMLQAMGNILHEGDCVKPDELCMKKGQPACLLKTSYFGKKNTTVSGKTCQMWNSQEFHSHSRGTEYGPVNFCRNPDKDEGPWCYTTDKDTRYEFCFNTCDMPSSYCVNEIRECVHQGTSKCKDKLGYQGLRNKTVTGTTCQHWNAQLGHMNSKYSSLPENYCRNDGDNAPWCYTANSWEYCFKVCKPYCFNPVRQCSYQGTEKCMDPLDYQGWRNKTVTGTPCQNWDANVGHMNSKYSSLPENYCRTDDRAGPWCYTAESWEYCHKDCSATPCVNEEKQCSFLNSLACQDPESYQGTKSTTIDGNPCLRWDSLSGSKRKSFAHNYCRSSKVSASWVVSRYAPVCYYNNTKGKEQRAFCFPSCTVDEYLKTVNIIKPMAPLFPTFALSDCVKPDESCMKKGQPTCLQKMSYLGKKNTTVSGKTCQMWNSQEFHSHTKGIEYGATNFCRNPDKSKGPWCYTMDKNTRWELCFHTCDITEPCVTNDESCMILFEPACRTANGYLGNKTTTKTGKTCQMWNSNEFHTHSEGTEYGAVNFCRNPNGAKEGPWCYTTDRNTPWEYCFNLCELSRNIVFKNSTQMSVPDQGSVESQITIDSDGIVSDVNVEVTVKHTYSGDLKLILIAPDKTQVVLSCRAFDCENCDQCSSYGTHHPDIYNGTVFDQQATRSIRDEHAVPLTGHFQPFEDLSVLNGKPSRGTWTIRVSDHAGEDIGTLIHWSIDVTEKYTDHDKTQLGFIDSLPVKNNLNGDLKGMVQFAQSHTIFPTPESNWVQDERFPLPLPVTHREALLIFIPAYSTEASSFSIKAFHNGTLLQKFQLAPPSQFPRSDQREYVNDSRPLLQYSLKAWSAVLPWNWMEHGLSLWITDSSTGKEGVLENIEFESPAEVVLIMTRLGLLTPPVDKEMYMEGSSEAAAKYFQTIPAAQLTVGKYLPVHWKVVVKANGTIYNNTCSSDEGGSYSGDLRLETASDVISWGVQRANRGNPLDVDDLPEFSIQQVPNVRGCYRNGIVTGCCTGSPYAPVTSETVGNEFSHEIGHSMGYLPHLPELGFHSQLSGWGFDAYRKQMIGNMKWTAYPDLSYGYGSYRRVYSYGTDPMWGGHTDKVDYHPYTGFGARKMQEKISGSLIPDLHSPTGRSQWDRINKKLIPFSDPRLLKPVAVGVPVITLVGFLDPEGELPSYIFPPLIGNYGHVYPLPKPDKTNDHCMLEVEYGDVSSTVSLPPFLSRSGSKVFQQINLKNERDKSDRMNDVSVNLHWDSDFIPKKAALKCSLQGKETALAERVFDSFPDHKSMSKPVVIGKKERYSQVKPDKDKTIYQEFAS